MNDGASHDPTSAMSDGRNNPEPQTEEERIFSTKFQTSSWKLPPQAQSLHSHCRWFSLPANFAPLTALLASVRFVLNSLSAAHGQKRLTSAATANVIKNDQSAGRKILRDGHGIRPSPHVAPQKTTEHGLCTPALSWLV